MEGYSLVQLYLVHWAPASILVRARLQTAWYWSFGGREIVFDNELKEENTISAKLYKSALVSYSLESMPVTVISPVATGRMLDDRPG
jgi:hypothetical protein